MLGNVLDKDYEVLLAGDGREALDIVKKEEGRLSLILLDLHMPVMNGYEFFDILKNDEKLSKIPVIVLTSEKEAEVKSLKMGAADFIPKPYDVPEVILARIDRTVQLYEDKHIITATQFDTLTGLFNREFFVEYSAVFDQYYPDHHKYLIALNFNRFHVINAVNGRDFGDKILKTTGRTIKEYVSSTKGLACNSIKDSYNTHIAYYDDEIRKKEHHNEILIHDLDKALLEDQFKVFYQPKYAIQGDAPVLSSSEALIRWEHPTLGMISPGDFIPLFENNGLIGKVDRYVWKQAAGQIADWKKRYGITIPVSVNVSRMDLMNEGFKDEITGIVKDAGITPKEYYLEITESAYTDNESDIFFDSRRTQKRRLYDRAG